MDIDDLYKSLGLERPSDDENKHQPDGDHIKARIDQTLNFDKTRNIFWRKWYAIAASLAFLIVSAAGIYNYTVHNSAPGNMITITAPSGGTREVILPDGSRVWLNAASVLRYPASFGKTREVFLEEGEGFFQVKRDTTAPFTVHSSHLDTRVLGTSFRVKAYKELSHEIVTVVSGKVAVSRGAEPLALLEKDQEVIFDKNSGNEKEMLVEAAESVDWKSGNVILKSVRFEDLILAVENAYQVSIHFDRQKFKECENSIRFSTHQSLESVMDLVRDIQGIRYEIKGKEVIVSGEGCQ
ncbi:FecR family protein [Dyadobacter sp. CY351]|uniref:FecR family protein n=1 Tax=Dyadobacter sp. CY351 TaxID=2909337 RepID=UPI001F242DBA|nr:FecR family protein [Dyadobacter sp. CY351]MCF2517483.1 FecR domain-containing protein [Dyadobacter sp. CY351]